MATSEIRPSLRLAPALLATLLALVVAAPASASSALEAGAGLQTLEGTPRALEPVVRSHRAVVLVFWSAGCPCVRRYQMRVEALKVKYELQGVAVLGIASNAGETAEEIEGALADRGVTLEVLRDPGGRLAAAVSARSTPTVAVLDDRGEVVFLGWIDNERQPGVKGRVPYLERALDAILAGEGGYAKRSPVYACRITRKLFGGDEPSHCEPVPQVDVPSDAPATP